MKNILIATTALMLSAGIAAAESHAAPVTVSGNARMGVMNNGTDTAFTSRVRASLKMSGTTDGGLSFGGSFDVHNAAAAANGSSGSVFLSGAFGKIAMGDVDSAVQAAVGQVDQKSLLVLDGPQEVPHIGGGASADDPSLLYSFTTGNISLFLGATDGKTGIGGAADERISVGAKFATDKFSVGVGFADDGAATETSVGGSATFGAATVKAVVSDRDDALGMNFALSVSGTFSGVGVTAFFRDGDSLVDPNIGVGASYDLGGGATVVGGVGSVAGSTVADLGVSFSF